MRPRGPEGGRGRARWTSPARAPAPQVASCVVRIARFAVGSDDPRFAVVEGLGSDGSLDDAFLAVVEGDPLYRPVQFTGERVPVAAARLLAPVIPRSKVVGVGRNYRDHAAEMGTDVPAEPMLFLKPNTAVCGPGDAVVLPAASAEVHHEAELAVVIGRLCRHVPAERADEVILGYTCANDVTARDLQHRDGQWSRAKGFDTFCPLVRQRGSTADLVHGVPALVAAVSAVFTLLPGDVILTGTPAGVGPLQAGDRVEVEIAGLGTLHNLVTDDDED